MIADVIGSTFGKQQPSAPTPPDYAGAATAQGNANMDAAIATGILNRPNQVSPLGSQSWNQTGSYMVGDRAVPQFTSSVNLTPQGQSLYDKGMNLQTGMMDLGGSSLKNAQGALSKPFDPSNNRDAIVDAMYRRATRMMDPMYQQAEENNKAELINKGFSVGDEGYTRALNNFNLQKDNAYSNARDQAMTGGANQAVQEALVSRAQPLQELNAIRTGAMPQMPNFGAQTQAGGVGAAPVMAGAQAGGNAAMQQYGIDTGSYNNFMQGLFSLGSAAMMA